MLERARAILIITLVSFAPAIAADEPKQAAASSLPSADTKGDAKKPEARKSGKQSIAPTIIPNFKQPDLSPANNAYSMTPEDLALDCKKLTGKIHVGIMQLRRSLVAPQTSSLSRTMQQVATPFIAGSTRGINPDGDNARDLERLRTFNRQLVVKACQPFDIDAELQPGATNTPRPIPKAKPPAKTLGKTG
jgi:hypothetical protein